jgi:hypothetical protein
MATEIRVIINNYGTFCGNCRFVHRTAEGWYCNCFLAFLNVNPDQSFSRLDLCLVGEGVMTGLRIAQKERSE